MRLLDLKDISERYMELINPSCPEKLLQVGRVLGLSPHSRVIDFGCGFAEMLSLWADHYGISGVGIDIREHACQRARAKVEARGLADRIQIICGDAARHQFEKRSFDVAVCLGASFIWDGFRPTVQAMRSAIKLEGNLVVGEPHWLHDHVPPEYVCQEQSFHSERELLQIVREEGFDLLYVVRASHDDWDRYQSDNWYGLVHWLQDNQDHPERQEVLEHLHSSQDEYFRYGRQYLGWAIYLFTPAADDISRSCHFERSEESLSATAKPLLAGRDASLHSA
mgnify:CR=1 FL=1